MGILDKILGYIKSDNANEIVGKIDSKLKEFQYHGMIDDMERDALRHYFGIRGLSSKFGETPAWLMGLINEGWESILPWEAREQVEADMYNNNIAFEDLNKERGFNLEDINTLDDINSILERLKIPPPLEY